MLARLKTLTLRCALCVGAVVVALAPAPAHAQFGMQMGMGAAQGEMITRRGVETYAKILGLDKDQREVALTLLEGVQTEYKAAQKTMEEGFKVVQDKVADTQDFSLYQKEMPKIGKEFGDKSKALEKSFFDDLKASCNDGQLAKWPKLERFHRRETGLRFAFVSGAAIDLIQITERTRATPAATLEPVLDQYELDMDKSLVAFKKMEQEAQDDMLKGEGNMFDMSRVETVLKRFYDVSKDMRELNRDYARKLSQTMDDASKSRFDEEFKKRSFPRVYKQAHVVKMMDAALGFPDLDKNQKEQITSLKSGYAHDVVGMNEKWAKAVEDREDKAGGTILAMMKSMQMMQGGGGGDLNKDVNEARTARKELDAKTKDRLTALLTEDQKAKLPEAPREDNNPWADMMPQADDQESGN
jgi:hypothetical protein